MVDIILFIKFAPQAVGVHKLFPFCRHLNITGMDSLKEVIIEQMELWCDGTCLELCTNFTLLACIGDAPIYCPLWDWGSHLGIACPS